MQLAAQTMHRGEDRCSSSRMMINAKIFNLGRPLIQAVLYVGCLSGCLYVFIFSFLWAFSLIPFLHI